MLLRSLRIRGVAPQSCPANRLTGQTENSNTACNVVERGSNRGLTCGCDFPDNRNLFSDFSIESVAYKMVEREGLEPAGRP
jgi:hypothetical protein